MHEAKSHSTEIKPPRHLLVVDDEAPIREVLKSFLDKQGYQVATAATGAETLKLVRALPIDLVILDVVLEDTDGLDLLAKLKRTRPRCPVIIITGLAEDAEIKRRALERGASECISKLSSLDQLSGSIERALAAAMDGPTDRPAEPQRRARRPSATRSAPLSKTSRRAGPATEKIRRASAAGVTSGENINIGTHSVEALPVSLLAAPAEAKTSPAEGSPLQVATLHDALGIQPRDTPRAEPGAVARFISVAPEAARVQSTVEVFLRMLSAYHANLANTAMRAAVLCKTLGTMLRLPANPLQALLWAAALQDISLVQIDRELVGRWLRGPEKCGKRELALIRRHPERSQRMLDFCPALKDAGEIILAHHENWDGSGFPGQLRMEMIPWPARLLAVVTFYCAKHTPTEKTLAEIQIQANQLYDPRAVEAAVKAAALTPLPRGEREVIASALKPGMVLSGDIFNWKGVLIIGKGTELSQARITRIIHLTELGQIDPRVLVWG